MKLLFALLLLFSITTINANNIKDRYLRADSLSKMFSNKVLNDAVKADWNNHQFWYRNRTSTGSEFIVIDADKKTQQPLFNHSRLAKDLSKLSGKEIDKDSLPLDKIKLDPTHIIFSALKERWKLNRKSGKLLKIEEEKKESKSKKYWSASEKNNHKKRVISPDKKQEAFLREYNIWVVDVDSKEETQLSFDGSAGEYYLDIIKWSPDSKKVICPKYRTAEQHYIYFMESSPKDQIQPILQKREYTKPGDALPIVTPKLFDLESKKEIQLKIGKVDDQFRLNRFNWRDDSKTFTYHYNQRGHQVYKIVEVDASTGDSHPIVEEISNTFIHYGRIFTHDLQKSGEFICSSERDGWKQLYLFDSKTGTIKNRITDGEYVVRGIDYVDEKNRKLIFHACGFDKDEDPYYIKYYSINFDGTDLKQLTPENGNHKVKFSEDYSYFVDSWSRVDTPPISVLRTTNDGSIILNLESADISELKSNGWRAAEQFKAKGRDGVTDIYGIIIRPTDFDPTKSYPVIEYIYAGPHDSFVPKDFTPYFGFYTGLAELGFIVVQIDGMGTANRSKAFHDICWKNLKDSGFPDRIAWMKAAAEKYPYMDLDRVGIFGGSAGGQSSTAALLFHPEFYKVAVSACGCHDNRMDKIWWNEQWMGYPIGKEYSECSNVDNAYRLKGELMLILGELDDNVDPSSTIQVVDALIDANKDFEYVLLPGMNHTIGGKYGERKRRDFFVKHLLHTETPIWNR